jgi:hypothetical protein
MTARHLGGFFIAARVSRLRNFQRMKYPLVACLGLVGLTQSALISSDVRFGSKADIAPVKYDVRFTPKSGH